MQQLAWPVHLAANGLATISAEDAPVQRVALLCATIRGERPDAPAFGTADGLGGITVDTDTLHTTIDRFDPGVDVTITETTLGNRTDITVEVHS